MVRTLFTTAAAQRNKVGGSRLCSHYNMIRRDADPNSDLLGRNYMVGSFLNMYVHVPVLCGNFTKAGRAISAADSHIINNCMHRPKTKQYV